MTTWITPATQTDSKIWVTTLLTENAHCPNKNLEEVSSKDADIIIEAITFGDRDRFSEIVDCNQDKRTLYKGAHYPLSKSQTGTRYCA